jgi:hypothetical protein
VVPKPIDDHFLQRYRELLDAEDQAFDALEHAVEDGDAAAFKASLHQWRVALDIKIAWLHNADYEIDGVADLGS